MYRLNGLYSFKFENYVVINNQISKIITYNVPIIMNLYGLLRFDGQL